MNKFLISLASLLTWAMESSASQLLIQVKPVGDTVFNISGAQSHISLSQAGIPDAVSAGGALVWGGDIGQFPLACLRLIKIDDLNVVIPYSGYADLCDVRFASASKLNSGFVIELHGGETATAYDAVLYFNARALVKRVVKLREFPNRKEVTNYYFEHGTVR